MIRSVKVVFIYLHYIRNIQSTLYLNKIGSCEFSTCTFGTHEEKHWPGLCGYTCSSHCGYRVSCSGHCSMANNCEGSCQPSCSDGCSIRSGCNNYCIDHCTSGCGSVCSGGCSGKKKEPIHLGPVLFQVFN